MSNKIDNKKEALDEAGPIGRFTDSEGYTAEIVPYQKEQGGKTFIIAPDGEKIEDGGWMDLPEAGWTHNGVDLYKDHRSKRRAGKRSVWEQLPLIDRLNMEAKQQATAYDPLSIQFKRRKEWAANPYILRISDFINSLAASAHSAETLARGLADPYLGTDFVVLDALAQRAKFLARDLAEQIGDAERLLDELHAAAVIEV